MTQRSSLMLRLLIVDDERIIRETISTIIDWKALDIEVVGLCKNGIEAYNMIIDEYPDIVLTDIKMPGLSGLELIRQVYELHLNIEFIILSGYGEFSFAKEAMQYGVQHYLLKPCNEDQIQIVMKKVILKCYDKQSSIKSREQQLTLTKQFHSNIIFSIIIEALNSETSLNHLVLQYNRYLDVYHTTYHQFNIYYLEERFLDNCLEKLNRFNKQHCMNTLFFYVYVKNTLIIFFDGYDSSLKQLEDYINTFTFANEQVSIVQAYYCYSSLLELLTTLLDKVKRYSLIYLINDMHKIPTANYKTVLSEYKNQSSDTTLSTLINCLKNVQDLDLLKSLTCSVLLKNFFAHASTYTPIKLLQLLSDISTCNNSESIFNLLEDKASNFYVSTNEEIKYKSFIKKALNYINENYSNPNLTLKWVAENYLYMNVDYVSKQFLKQTGVKFSTYLTNIRIDKSKELLLEKGSDKIYDIAKQIGFGNNPQYFSQIFKKSTGMTPTEYVSSQSLS